jgi:hypothetical protein
MYKFEYRPANLRRCRFDEELAPAFYDLEALLDLFEFDAPNAGQVNATQE